MGRFVLGVAVGVIILPAMLACYLAGVCHGVQAEVPGKG